jgi:outer membrane biosynthesis protein TonB
LNCVSAILFFQEYCCDFVSILARPNAPENLRISPEPSGNALILSWDISNTSVDSFIIEMKGEGEQKFTPVATVDGKISQVLIEHLVKTKVYTFRVIARNAAGLSESASMQMEAPLQKKVDTEKLTQESALTEQKTEKTEELPVDLKQQKAEESQPQVEPKVKAKKAKKPEEKAPKPTDEPAVESVKVEEIKPVELPKVEQAPQEEIKTEPVVPAEVKRDEQPVQQAPAGRNIFNFSH